MSHTTGWCGWAWHLRSRRQAGNSVRITGHHAELGTCVFGGTSRGQDADGCVYNRQAAQEQVQEVPGYGQDEGCVWKEGQISGGRLLAGRRGSCTWSWQGGTRASPAYICVLLVLFYGNAALERRARGASFTVCWIKPRIAFEMNLAFLALDRSVPSAALFGVISVSSIAQMYSWVKTGCKTSGL